MVEVRVQFLVLFVAVVDGAFVRDEGLVAL